MTSNGLTRERKTTKDDHYTTLGVSKEASSKEIKSAFFGLSKKYHPDLSTGNAEKFVEIKDAYTVLMNEKARKDYDQAAAHPFSTRRTYSSDSGQRTARTGSPSGGHARRPLRTRRTGSEESGSGQFTGFEGDEKRWQAHRAAEEMRQQAQASEPHYNTWQREDEAWKQTAPNFSHVEAYRRSREKYLQAVRVMWIWLLGTAALIFVFRQTSKKPQSTPVPDLAASTEPPLSDYQPSRPGSRERREEALSTRQLNEERRIHELQREKLRLEMRLKAAAASPIPDDKPLEQEDV